MACEGERDGNYDLLKFNYDKKKCDITKKYCQRYGATPYYDNKLKTNNCKIKFGQKVLEEIFGTTVTRGLKQVFDLDQYEQCKSGDTDIGYFCTSSDISCGDRGRYQKMCYDLPDKKLPNDSSWVAGLGQVRKRCPKGSSDKYYDAITNTCKYSRGIGYKSYCPSGYKDLGVCTKGLGTYTKKTGGGSCPSGYSNTGMAGKCVAPIHTYGKAPWNSCRSGYRNLGVACARGGSTKNIICPKGYERGAGGPLGDCIRVCDTGHTNLGVACFRPKIGRAHV